MAEALDVHPEVNRTGGACIFGVDDPTLPYLAARVFPAAQQIPLAVGQDADSVVGQLGPDVRWFVWHALPTHKGGMPRHREALRRMLRERSIFGINERVVDISKRNTQAVLAGLGLPTTEAARGGEPSEKLFLKSNHNYGGRAERLMSQELRDYFGVAVPHPQTPEFKQYRVVERRHVQSLAFNLADVFVERFVENSAEVFYRAFIVFDAVVLSRIVCGGVIKKALGAEQRDDYFLSFSDADSGFASAPDDTVRKIMVDLARFCPTFGLDLGAVDILPDDDGVPHIIDANPTAWGGENCDRPGFLDHLTAVLVGRNAAAPS
ncbi:MAG: hypothetical protein RH942_14460 [Kiloniellaceae bacterium]